MTIEKRSDRTDSTDRKGWWLFWDMHSGGRTKFPPYEKIYVEADSEKDAIRTFQDRTGRDPDNVTCSCCGDDYSVSYDPTFAGVSGYHRGCAYDSTSGQYVEKPRDKHAGEYMTVEEYQAREDVLVITR